MLFLVIGSLSSLPVHQAFIRYPKNETSIDSYNMSMLLIIALKIMVIFI